jgi:hypothetical protein
LGSGAWTRTSDLRASSPTSYGPKRKSQIDSICDFDTYLVRRPTEPKLAGL